MSGLLAQHGGGATSELLAHHGPHILMLAGPLVLLAGLFAMLELTRPGRPRRDLDHAAWWLGLTWSAAATIHLAVVAGHAEASVLLGTFFLLLALAQYGYAVAVIRRTSQRLLLVGLVANLAVVLLWACTRTIGLPLGLAPREPVGLLDLVATALEIGAVVQTWVALRRGHLLAADAPTMPRREQTPVVSGVTPVRGRQTVRVSVPPT